MRGVKTLKLESSSTEKDGAKTGGAMTHNESNYFKLNSKKFRRIFHVLILKCRNIFF